MTKPVPGPAQNTERTQVASAGSERGNVAADLTAGERTVRNGTRDARPHHMTPTSEGKAGRFLGEHEPPFERKQSPEQMSRQSNF